MSLLDARGPEPLAISPIADARGPGGPTAVLALINLAIDKGVPVESLQTLQKMYHEEMALVSKRQYTEALSRFQSKCPPVPADAELGHLSRVGRDGIKRAVRFASIQGLRDWMQPYLDPEGFSVTLDAETSGNMMTAIATLRHIGGHSESSRFTLPTDAKTPAMSPQQAYEAAYSFACRIALRSVTGVRVSAEDGGAEAEVAQITEAQAATITALMEEAKGKFPVEAFLKWLNAERVEHVRANRYDEAVKYLERKRKG